MMNYKLKPCPFCGCEMKLETEQMISGLIRYTPKSKGNHKRGCQLEFSACAFVGQPTTIRGAIKKWNRRAINDQWISVKNELPKKGDYVLVCFDDGFITGVAFEEDFELWADSGEPTHWMPLPEPPKGG